MAAAATAPTPLRTEDTGKMFEKAICLAYEIPYDGKYKYGLEMPTSLAPRLQKLKDLFPACVHTAKRGARYDFTATSDSGRHLSAKTTKRGCGKVAPQVIGQAQPTKFCEVLGIPFEGIPALKMHIQAHIADTLPVLTSYTFDCDIVYFNNDTKAIRHIKLKGPIDWSAETFTWTRAADAWANSSTLQVRGVALLEIQFHTKSRTNMAIRWCFDTVLDLFADRFEIVEL
jgi:hypothetical protein